MRTAAAVRIGSILPAGVLGVTSCSTSQAPSAIVTATASRVSTATVELAPSPTPAPAERLQQAGREQQNGNYEAAGAMFEAIAQAQGDPSAQRQAMLQLGRCQLQAEAYPAAGESLRRYIAAYPGDPEAATAYFWLGEALRGAGDGGGAADAYRAYLQRRSLLSDYVREHKITAGSAADATPTSTSGAGDADAANSQPTPEDAPSTEDEGFQSGIARYLAGDLKAAIAAWTPLLGQEIDPPMRACLLVWLGKAAEREGSRSSASTVYRL